jgi:hypothetical protein
MQIMKAARVQLLQIGPGVELGKGRDGGRRMIRMMIELDVLYSR